MKKIIVLFFFCILFVSSCSTKDLQQEITGDDKSVDKTYKILHIMSYHSPWIWTDDQLNGFKKPLEDLNIEYKVFQMDTKRQSSDKWKEKVGKEARVLIDEWRPDLVYTNDDNAQIYVTKFYLNSSIPFVFSGVNAKPEKYGFTHVNNIAGVLEQPHFVETVKLMKDILPDIRKVGVITDDGPTWPPMVEMMKEKVASLDEIEIVSWDTLSTFEEYKQKINEYQDTVDAICHLGVFIFEDEQGNNVPYEEVMEWTVKNSNLPDFSFWEDRVKSGELASVTVSGYEQGLAAGNIARGILVEGKSPSEFDFKPTTTGEIVISLARANDLNIALKPHLVSSAEIIEEYSWGE